MIQALSDFIYHGSGKVATEKKQEVIFKVPWEKRKPAHPQFLSKRTPLPTRVRKEKGGAHGVQAGKIRIIILRRFIIPWTGPVRGKFAGGRWFCSVFPLELFPRWPLLAEDKEKGSWKITTRRA
jgi:hypothetical protein